MHTCRAPVAAFAVFRTSSHARMRVRARVRSLSRIYTCMIYIVYKHSQTVDCVVARDSAQHPWCLQATH